MQKILTPDVYVDPRYLDIAAAFFHPIKQRSHELMRICPGQVILDVGCGAGLDVLSLADWVGPSGRVFGLDKDPLMIAEAERRAELADIGSRITYRVGEAADLPFPANNFDACRTERMLMHVANPRPVVAELHRVLMPGGWLVLLEPDWGTLSIAIEDVELERRFVRILAGRFLQNGYSGRRLYRLMRELNFQEVSIDVIPVWSADLSQTRYLAALDQVEAFALAENLFSHEELAIWREELGRAQEEACFFASLNMVMVSGRKCAPC